MKLDFVRARNSITGPVAGGDLADFIVLSGPNGSGKSHLLEAIQFGAVRADGAELVGVEQQQPGIRMFTLAQLVAAADGPQSVMHYRDRWVQLKAQVESFFAQSRTALQGDALEAAVRQQIVGGRTLTQAALDGMLLKAGKPLAEFDDNDYRMHSPMIHGIRDPFTMSVTELFLTYHSLRLRNEQYQWRRDVKGDETVPALEDDEFVHRYGPPPWELLDETAALVGLEYQFDAPHGFEEDLSYETRLIHKVTGVPVTLAQLSSGERTLMAIVMTLYSGTRLGEAIELPRILLLDEADASLHPSMVASLLRVAEEMFHQRYGVSVILATHSPSTVALAPESALYTMRATGDPRLEKVSRDVALQALTVGIPTLSVRNEYRRQVFVESEWDESCYQELFRHLRPRFDSPLSLEFIASGRGGAGSCDAVKHLVTSLRGTGNTTIQGIVDRDSRAGSGDGIVFVNERYALENLVLDPLPLGVFLLRERLVSAADIGLAAGVRHFELGSAEAQPIADFVCSRVAVIGGGGLESVTVRYAGGLTADIPRWYLDAQGHQLEAAIAEAFPSLKAYRSRLKLRVVETAYADVPGYTPIELIELFKRLLTVTTPTEGGP